MVYQIKTFFIQEMNQLQKPNFDAFEEEVNSFLKAHQIVSIKNYIDECYISCIITYAENEETNAKN